MGLIFGLGPGPAAALDFGRTVLFSTTDFFVAGVFSGVMVGVTFFAGLRLAYGSAVAGLAISGFRGRRIGAAMREPDAAALDEAPNPDLDEVLPDMADGGRVD
jgi:hypothetical protein